MTKVNYVKNVPLDVRRWFELNFPVSKGFSYEFYWYRGGKGDNEKIYGCNVSKNGKFWHNATQMSVENYHKNYRKYY